MATIHEIEGFFATYEEAVEELEKNKRVFDGVLGLGNHPGSAACHELLDREIGEICQRDAEEERAPEERLALIRRVYQAERAWKGPEYARLMLVAIQRHTIPLIALLPEAERGELAQWYERTYPRRIRLPVQEEVLSALTGKARRRFWKQKK